MKGIFCSILLICMFLIMFKISQSQMKNQQKQQGATTPPETKCQKMQYTSTFTKCQINLDDCNGIYFKFVNCYKKQCQRYIRGSQCRLWVHIQLTENQCYKQCCGSSKFIQNACSQYNVLRQQTQSSINGIIIAVIVISATILLAVVGFLLIKVQKCCDKKQTRKIAKYNINWRPQIVPNWTCDICKDYGAFISTPCHHYFHACCLEQNADQQDVPLCPTCQSPIKQRIKVGCMGCKQRVFKVKLWKLQHLSQILSEAYALHDDVCPLTARSDQLLLSPVKQ